MTTLDAGYTVSTASPEETPPFHHFVTEGAGQTQARVLARFLHALNNLLTVTNGYISLLDSNQSGSESLRDLHDKALHAGERAAAASQALQSLTLGHANSDELQPAFMDELIRRLEPLLSAVMGKQLPIHLDLSSEVGPVLLNPVKFLRAVTACVTSTLSEPSSGSIHITVRREQRPATAQPGAALLRIVSMAQPGDSPCSAGFSLEELNDLLHTWNGEARWAQTQGAHWDLRILLPVCHGPRAPQYDGLRAPVGARPCWRVLVVEENATQLRHLESGLLDAGLAVASFTGGSAALESVRKDPQHYNLVITDIVGPDLTGLELARALRVESPCTHVVFSTKAERLHLATAMTSAPVLSKPFNMARVLETVDSICGTLRPRILVADDESPIRLLVRQCLSEETYEVFEAEDGMQACEALQSREFELLIVDLVMPAHEGLETIRSICRRTHELKILAISGQRPEYLKAAALLGANAVLRKPFSPAELRIAVERLLSNSETTSV